MKPKEVVIPFDSQAFIEAWNLWKEYRKEQHKFVYRSAISEQAALKKLVKLAEGNDIQAIDIIEQSMAEGWRGLFNLKQNGKNGTSKSKVEMVIEASNTFVAPQD